MSLPSQLIFNKCYARRPSTTYTTIADTRWAQCTEDKDSALGDGKLCRLCYETLLSHRARLAEPGINPGVCARFHRLGPRGKGWHGMMTSGTCPRYSILLKRNKCEPHVIGGNE